MKIDKEKIERRTMKVTVPEIEERAEMEAPQPMIVEGYAVVYDTPQTYQFGDETYTETIVRGALDNADTQILVILYLLFHFSRNPSTNPTSLSSSKAP